MIQLEPSGVTHSKFSDEAMTPAGATAPNTIRTFGLAGKVLVVLTILALLTLGATFVTYYAITTLRQYILDMSKDHIPGVIVASRLSQQSESIVAEALNLSVAGTQMARRAARAQVADQANWLDEIIQDLHGLGVVDPQSLSRIAQIKGELIANLQQLNTLVEQRIEIDLLARKAAIRLRAVDALVQGTVHDALYGQRQELLRLLYECSAGQAESVGPPCNDEIAHLALANHDAIAPRTTIDTEFQALSIGDTSIPELRRRAVKQRSAIEFALARNRQLSQQLVSAASQMVNTIQRNAINSTDASGALATQWQTYSLVLSLVVALGLVSAFLYSRRSVLYRLLQLQRHIGDHRSPDHPLPCAQDQDEIGDIARALLNYQTQIDLREQQLRKRHQELYIAVERAEAANRAKSVFLHQMSHELRTPLNAVIGFSEIIRDKMMGDGATDLYSNYAGDIYFSANKLLAIIANIIEVSQLATSARTITRAWVGAEESLMAVVDQVRPLASSRQITLVTDTDAAPAQIYTDVQAFGQIGQNLLSNAIAFTPPNGHVTVTLKALTTRPGVLLVVSDTGVGMTTETIERSLQPFEFTNTTAEIAINGPGFGILVSRYLAELHGGTLEIESDPGRGTTVSVSFPNPA